MVRPSELKTGDETRGQMVGMEERIGRQEWSAVLKQGGHGSNRSTKGIETNVRTIASSPTQVVMRSLANHPLIHKKVFPSDVMKIDALEIEGQAAGPV